MSKLLKYSELARALGMSNASISMALKNGIIEKEETEKAINIEKPVNKLWINNQIVRGKVLDLNNIYAKPKPPKPKQQTSNESKEITLSKKITGIKDESYIEKKKALELKKLRQAVKLDALKIQKIEGHLIPYDAVKTVFLFAVETFRSTYLQEVDALSNVFIKRLGGTHDNFIELQKELQEKINEIQATVKGDLLQGLKGIQAEYKEVRGRGERK